MAKQRVPPKKLKMIALPASSRRPIAHPKSHAMPHFIVGIGASAGGLEALRSLFGALKDTNEMAFVVVQHLAPLYRSRLVELIAHTTNVQVKEVRNDEVPVQGVIYITPPNRDVVIEHGILRLKKPQSKIGPKPSVDLFFKSLAEDRGDRAIGIILSGTGSDGSFGIRAIKSHGGMTIAQKGESAKYDGMPKAARLTGAVDFELTPEEIAKELERYRGTRSKNFKATLPKKHIEDPDPFKEILAIVQREMGADFAQYKPATIRRRIERRMVATHVESLPEYVALLTKSREEAKLLFQDILISVTAFFRDPDAFKALDRRLLDRIKSQADGGSFRAWIIGCATGEEAYSIAILISEVFERLKIDLPVQIFATDLDEHALAIARKGIYSKASLGLLSSAMLEKYFVLVDDRYQIKSKLRDSIVFARHNVTQDPPFLNMDLISCRNVLIYFSADLQEIVFKTAHYALARSGLLFLGKSETVGGDSHLFDVRDKSAKIYIRIDRKGEMPRLLSRIETKREEKATRRDQDPSLATDLYSSMVASFAPDSVVVGEGNEIRHLYGNAGKYLKFAQGEATHNVVKLLGPELGIELTSLLHRAHRDRKMARGSQHEIKFGDQTFLMRMSVAPLVTGGTPEYLVAFESLELKVEKPEPRKKGAPEVENSLEEKLKKTQRELAAVQDQLQTITQEQETVNEELQSLNEELQSANEELQSSNEELETANEEMQSTNEELTTVNQELNVKSAELITLNQTLQAIQNAIIYPLIIVDKNLRLTSFNPAARYLFKVNESDLGHTLRSISTRFDLLRVVGEIERAFRAGGERQLQLNESERSFEVQIQLYRGAKDIIEGAVVSFVENTEIVSALESAKLIKHRLSDIMDNTPAMVTMKDAMGVYTYANRRFAELVHSTPDDVLGQTDEELIGPKVAERLRERDFEVSKRRHAIQSEEQIEVDGKQYWWASARFPLLDAKNRVQSVCTISLDTTEAVLRRQQLELFKQAISSATDGIVLLEETPDGDFRSTFVSTEFAGLVGLNAEKLEGTPLRTIISPFLPRSKAKLKTPNPKLAETRGGDSRAAILCRDFQSESGRWI